jgi:hypothetical protein
MALLFKEDKIMRLLRRLIESNLIFGIFIAIFIISVGIAAVVRGGKDLKVDLFGVEQVLQKKSPYDNPNDPNRPIFRYAPPFALMMRPFLIGGKQIPDQLLLSLSKYTNIDIIIFYITKIFLLFLIVFFLLKLIPCSSLRRSGMNFKLAFFLSMPFIGYELTNNQNKLIALCFIIFSLYLFDQQRLWLSSLFFNLALVVYLPLIPFIIYFLKYRKKFIITFIVTFALVFIIIPSFIWGIHYNNFLLKDWFNRCLKPSFITKSYSTYIDLKRSSQSLPSAIGRIFVRGKTGNFQYLISPFFIHIIILFLSLLVSLLTFFAIWFSKDKYKGLEFSTLLILSMILPQYCIYYTWAYLLVIYFSVFNYIDLNKDDISSKKILLTFCILVFITTCLIWINVIKYLSVLFWSTLALWLVMVYIMLKSIRYKRA